MDALGLTAYPARMRIRIYVAKLDALENLLGSSDPRPIARKLKGRGDDERERVLQVVDLGHALRKLDEDVWLFGLEGCCGLIQRPVYEADLRWEAKEFPELDQLVTRHYPESSKRYRCDSELGSLNHVPLAACKRLASKLSLRQAAVREEYVRAEWAQLRRAVSAGTAAAGLLTFGFSD